MKSLDLQVKQSKQKPLLKAQQVYKLLIGKCPDTSHLKISCKAMKILIAMVINLTYEENFLLNKAIKEIGKLTNKK